MLLRKLQLMLAEEVGEGGMVGWHLLSSSMRLGCWRWQSCGSVCTLPTHKMCAVGCWAVWKSCKNCGCTPTGAGWGGMVEVMVEVMVAIAVVGVHPRGGCGGMVEVMVWW